MYIDLRSLSSAQENGSEKKSVAFIFLFCIYNHIQG